MKSVDSNSDAYDARLPNELVIHIATFLDPATLVRAERVCKQWQALLHGADAPCWARHAGHGAAHTSSLTQFVRERQDNCIDAAYWQAVESWKEAVRRLKALSYNWSEASKPLVETSVLGFIPANAARATTTAGLSVTATAAQYSAPPVTRSRLTGRPLNVPQAAANSSHVWRARLDPAHDAQFIITTWLAGGLRVVDARPNAGGAILWELPRWKVRPYAHLEYRQGIACWDSEHGIEVWKRWKLAQSDVAVQKQDEPPNKRGIFVHVGTIPELPGMRGFMLNEALHLTIVSQAGRSWTYDVGVHSTDLMNEGSGATADSQAQRRLTEVYNFPIKSGGSWVYDFPIQRGATGHIEHNQDHVVFCMGNEGYAVYHKASAKHLGDIKFNEGPLASALEQCAATNMLRIDPESALPVSHADTVFQLAHVKQNQDREQPIMDEAGTSQAPDTTARPATEERTRLGRRLPPRVRKPTLQEDEWGATMIRRLDDGATLLVARSMGGRFIICSDLLGLLTCIDEGTQEMIDAKVRECLAIVECGGTRCLAEFHAGGWLTVHGGRAAWEIEDRVYLLDLPDKKNKIPDTNTRVMTLNGRYAGELPMPNVQVPISIMSLHDDCLLTTYLHPAYVYRVDADGQPRWETSVLKSVRLVRFAPRALEVTRHPSEHKDDDKDVEGDADGQFPINPRDLAMHYQWHASSRFMVGHAIQRAENDEILARLREAEAEAHAEAQAQAEVDGADDDDDDDDEDEVDDELEFSESNSDDDDVAISL